MPKTTPNNTDETIIAKAQLTDEMHYAERYQRLVVLAKCDDATAERIARQGNPEGTPED